MDELATEDLFEGTMEILLPQDHRSDDGCTRICLCCQRPQPFCCMDEDGCGICDDCLAP